MVQFDIYPNSGQKQAEIPYLFSIQNDHITSRTGATVVIPLRANARPVEEVMAPLVKVSGQSMYVLSTDAIFAIDPGSLSDFGRR